MPNGLPANDPLAPAKADFIEVNVGMLGPDVVEYASNDTPDPIIEPFGGIGVDSAARIFAC
jgi:hypothetical protein